MTEDQKYEIATLATDVARKQAAYTAHLMANTPTDPIERERAMAAMMIAQTEYFEACAAMARAQARIVRP